ncbi:hypothetical protein SUDANB145_01439 [Streptomyces sp. enrichment culture]|uniref:CU044_2847 family protein n=1 Tax=Streptomyces sp. ISL-12 TaxID=2819177 RepID=UPI001BE6E793|nr:CU044_2847 family protein [Streptomyces sp. ISL-12]MBT2414207.1 hypothetical protein [Streptomyces sp. ISL-12]
MSNRMLPVRVGDVELLVETVPVAGSEPTSRLGEAGRRVTDSFDQVRDAVVEIGTSAAQAVGRLRAQAVRPEQVEVEFGLRLSVQGNVVLVGSSGEASLVVRMTYRAPEAESRP